MSLIFIYMKRKQIPISLKVDLLDAIEKMASLQNRSRSNFIEAILTDAVSAKREEYRETRQLASLDRVERTRNTRPKKKKRDAVDDMPFE